MSRKMHAAIALALAALAPAVGSAAGLPDRIAQAKVIKVAVNAIYPPMEYKDPQSNELVGFDIDLGNALGKVLGVRFDWQESAFEQLLPSLATGRADLILSGLNDRPDRRESIDFIDYLNSGAQFFVLAERAGEFKAPADLCGKSVGSSRSTSFPKSIEAWSAQNCVAAGKPAIDAVGTEDTASARSQLKQRRLDAAVQGSETIPYAMTLEPGVYRPLGMPFTSVGQGIAFTKQDTQLRDAVLAALQKLMADGTYTAIVAKWHLEASAAKQIMLNGAPLP
jgi:polar amino acid transport system substrate-binding protein